MIWFNIKQLESQLKEGGLSDKGSFNYLVANMVLFTIMPYFNSTDFTVEWPTVLEILLVVAATVIGIKRTFQINTNGDNKDYLKRFISLSFVTGFRLFIIALISAIPLSVIVHMIEANVKTNELIDSLFSVLFLVIVTIIYYVMLLNSFKRVCQ